MAGKSVVDWDTIKADYLNKSNSVSDLCARHGIDRRRLYDRIRRDGWPMRQGRNRTVEQSDMDAAPDGAPSERRATGVEGTPLSARRTMIARLYSALERQMGEVEARLARKTGAPSGASEQDARTLSTLVRTLEKLSELDREAEAEDNASETDQPPLDIDEFREELTRRLKALRQQESD